MPSKDSTFRQSLLTEHIENMKSKSEKQTTTESASEILERLAKEAKAKKKAQQLEISNLWWMRD